ncbi:beclin-1-like protein A [Chironomus tepperi]|uniref:beclin-1-like protein A n=1 Tax=Chironomus tepperi TaxID=113505 RepID=UPI00391F4BD7
MTEFKYGSNNYHKKLSTADKAIVGGTNVTACDENSRKPRLKKSFSECEYYEMDSGMSGNFNLSPTRRKCRVDESHRFHHCPRQTTINDGINNVMGDISFIDIPKTATPYNYDTSKSQYLLAQQQKLKEYKNDPNYTTTNGDNYSSESSTETRGILKNKCITTAASSTTTSESNASNNNNNSNNSNKSLLKRNKGLSTLSLCSCDAETEVIPNQSRPLYQYSLDRKRPLHTYTCEQNAQILLRLERERLKKYGSYGRLHFTTLSNTEQPKSKQNRIDNGSLKDFSVSNTRIPGYPEANHIENEVFKGDPNRNPNNNNNSISTKIVDDDIIPPNFPPPPKSSHLQRSASLKQA